MDPGIAESIASALASRQSQREPAERLRAAWAGLADNVKALNDALQETGARFSRDHQVPGRVAIAQELDRWRSGDDLPALPGKIAGQTGSVNAIWGRAWRDTVNIGVVGQTGSGKSTFLQVVTNLPADVIPRGDGRNPMTAARSRFLHSQDRREAMITILSWEEFRDRYVAPLHKEGGCPGEPPATRRGFLEYDYAQRLATARQRQDQGEKPTSQEILERLIAAQRSFGSYEPLLGTSERIVPLEQLPPYVAYPKDRADENQPYHAVRDVWVYHPFIVDIEKLALVDLPGAGETGLDINRRFLEDLKYDVDVLLHIVYPRDGRARFGETDERILDIASSAKMGRDWSDFIYIVINENLTDPGNQENINNVRAGAARYAKRSGFTLLSGNASNVVEAQEEILLPVLRQLARRLEAMDRAVAGHVASETGEVAAYVAEVVGRLAASIADWQADVPPEDRALADKATRLRDQVAQSLEKMSLDYARRVHDKERLHEVDQSITEAVDRLREWAAGEFGATGDSVWRTRMRERFAAAKGRAMDEACTVARQKLRYEFGKVDASLQAAKRELHRKVASILQGHLKEGLVPAGDESFAVLLAKTEELGLTGLRVALKDLIAFRTGYGSIFLRVGRPVVAQITWERAVASRVGRQSSYAQEQAGRLAPRQPSPFFDGMRSLGAGARISVGVAGGGQPATVANSVAAFLPVLRAAINMGKVIAPIIADWLWAAAGGNDGSVESFRKDLSAAFDRAVDLIAEQMRAEAGQLTEALAAIVDEFYDGFTRVPGIEAEYKDLSYDFRHELWPGEFDGGEVDLAHGLSELRKAAADTVSAARTAAELAASLAVGK